MAKPIDIEKLLNFSTRLILEEIKNISELTKRGKLDHETAQDLVRYHAVLADRKFGDIQKEAKEKERVKRLTTDELLMEAEKEINAIKKQRENKLQQTKEKDNGPEARRIDEESEDSE